MNKVQSSPEAGTLVEPVAPLKLGYIIDSLTTGGAERLVVTFAEATKNRPDVRLTVFTLTDGQTPFRQALEALGVEVVVVTGRTILDPLRIRRLVKEMGQRSIEYLHAHLTSATIVGGIASRLARVPFATTVHNVKPSARKVRRIKQFVYRAALRQPNILRIAVGTAVAEAGREDSGGRPFVVVPNAVAQDVVGDPQDRSRLRSELGIDESTVVLIAVGSLIPQKAYPDLLGAFCGVPVPPDQAVKLLIVGRGGLDEEIRARVEDLGLGDRVTLLGLRNDIPSLLTMSDIFVSASHWEGAPVSLLEAIANGLPCVVTDVGDNREALEGTEAMLVPPAKPDALSEAMTAMIADPERRRRCAELGRNRVFERFGAQAWVETLLDLYVQATPRKNWRGSVEVGAE